MASKLIKKFFMVVLILIVGLVVWTFGALKFVYSTGERAGYVQKFSKKGWIFKTWEGELAMVALPGTIPEKFYFTVREDSVAQKIQTNMGQQVVINYNEHKGIPSDIFGETPHFVSDIHVVEDPSQPSTFPVTHSSKN